jgi:PAS domain S-box-containing protein
MKVLDSISVAQRYAILALACVFCIDMFSSPGFASGILYILCCLLVYNEERLVILRFTAVVTALMIARTALAYPLLTTEAMDYKFIFINRAISVMAVMLVALMAVHKRNGAKRVLREKNGLSKIVGFDEDVDDDREFGLRTSTNVNNSRRNVSLATFGMLAVFIIDIFIPPGIAFGAFYILCFLFIYSETRRVIISFAFVMPILIILSVFISYAIGHENSLNSTAMLANRVISVAVIILTTVLALRHRAMFEKFNQERDHYIQLLELSNEKLGAINKAVNKSLLSAITDKEGKIIYVNKLFKRTYQYRSDEIIGKDHCLLNSGYHTDTFFEEMWATIQEGKTWFGEMRNKAKDGSMHWVDTVIVPIKDRNGDIAQFYAMSKVIDDRKRLEEQLLKSNAEMEHFTYVAAHDLKSPVINMSVLSEMLEEVNGVTEEGMEYFDKIKQSIRQMELTISKLNEVISSKRNLSERPEEIEIESELQHVLHDLEHVIQKAGATITYDFSAAPKICIARVQMHSIFQNLISNAIKYAREGVPPCITITSIIQSDAICLRVADNGMGIDMETHKAKMFGLFKRFHQHVEGKGIGLYIVKSIIDNLGGQISVESELNKGTTFQMCFNIPDSTTENDPST